MPTVRLLERLWQRLNRHKNPEEIQGVLRKQDLFFAVYSVEAELLFASYPLETRQYLRNSQEKYKEDTKKI